jgi:spore photoproduct lyase
MGTEGRTTKRTKFGSEKQVYDAATMRALRGFFEERIAAVLPSARVLYWT